MISITYNAGSTYASSDDTTPIITEYQNGDEIILMGQLFSSAGYEIKEWNTSEDGTGTTYQLFEEYSGTDNLVLYAIWQISNAGQVKIKNGSEELDISNLLIGMTTYFGRNQPFPYTVLTMTKQLVDKEYWAERRTKDLSDPKYNNYTFPPERVQFKTRFSTDVFSVNREWLYERIEDNDDQTYSITCVDRTYMMKFTTLNMLFDFTYANDNYTFNYLDDINTQKTSVSSTEDMISISAIDFIGTVDVYIDHSNTPYITKISGLASNIFKIIAHTIGKYPYEDGFVIDEGYMPQLPANYEIKDSYTSEEIATLKGTHASLNGDGNVYRADWVTLRPDEYCWDVIKSLGLLSNRIAFFYDRAYFVDYYSTPHKYDDVSPLWIDWSGNDEQFEENGVTYTRLQINNLSANNDQGSRYVRSSQKVISEGYEATISISDANTMTSGQDIKFMYAENVSNDNGVYTFSTETRNFQTRLVALNTLIRYYLPGDAIQFDMAETYHANREFSKLPNTTEYEGEIVAINDDATLTTTYYKSSYVTPTTVKWTRVSDRDIEAVRDARFDVYSLSPIIHDEQNNIILNDAPLAQTAIFYPSMITQYTWGEPEFMDEENSLSSLEGTAQDSMLDNTSDTSISNNYSAKIVVGNQKLAELKDDRNGFSGLILEKNWDADLYRLSGYNNGSLQTYINSKGEFLSGDQTSPNRVKIDRNGLTIGGEIPTPGGGGNGLELWDSTKDYKRGEGVTYNNMVYVATSDNKGQTPSKSSTTYWQYQGSTSQLYGPIDASSNNVVSGGGYVKIDSSGLQTYNSSGTVQCSVGSNGWITAGNGAVRLNSEGMQTYRGTTLVTSIDTNGAFKTGYYNDTSHISLDNNGLVFTAANDSVMYDASAITFKDSGGTTRGKIRYRSIITPEAGAYPTIEFIATNGWARMSAGSGTSSVQVMPNAPPAVTWDGASVREFGAIISCPTTYDNYSSSNLACFLQAGVLPPKSAGTSDVTFDTPFPNGVLYAGATTIRSTSTGNGNDYVFDVTKTGMRVKHDSSDVGIYWIAVGY